SAQMMIDFAIKLLRDGVDHSEAQNIFRLQLADWLKNEQITKTESQYNLLHPKTFIPFQATSLGAQDKPEKRFKKPLKHPLTGKKCKMPNKNWKHCEETLMGMADYKDVHIADSFIVAGEIKYGTDETTIPRQA